MFGDLRLILWIGLLNTTARPEAVAERVCRAGFEAILGKSMHPFCCRSLTILPSGSVNAGR